MSSKVLFSNMQLYHFIVLQCKSYRLDPLDQFHIDWVSGMAIFQLQVSPQLPKLMLEATLKINAYKVCPIITLIGCDSLGGTYNPSYIKNIENQVHNMHDILMICQQI